MVANSAFLAGLVVLVAVLELVGQLAFLAPFKRVIFDEYRDVLVAALLVLFFNLYAAIYFVFRRVWLKETGRKLAHLEKQLDTGDTVARDLSERLAKQR